MVKYDIIREKHPFVQYGQKGKRKTDMFGYVKVVPSELKVKEYEFYRGVYCGLCRANGKHTGCASRLALSYDLVFLALIRMGLEHPALSVKKRRCLVHPFRARPSLDGGEVMRYTAMAGAMLAISNLDDKIADSHGVKKACYRCALPFTCTAKRKTRDYAALKAQIDASLDALKCIEAQKDYTPDRAADTFGSLLSCVFSYGLQGSDARIASEVGRHTGRWIYLIDAIDDLPSDRKSGAYNPYLSLSAEDAEAVHTALLLELSELERAVALIPFADRGIQNIVENIIYLGMPSCIDQVMQKTFGIHNETKEEETLHTGSADDHDRPL